MNKDERKSFYRYVNGATPIELEKKLIKLHSVLVNLKQSETIADAEWMIREITLEIDARRSLA